MRASEKKYVPTSYLFSFVPLTSGFFLAEHKIWRTRTICTFAGVPRTGDRRTEYPLNGSESGVPKRGGVYSLIFVMQNCNCIQKVLLDETGDHTSKNNFYFL